LNDNQMSEAMGNAGRQRATCCFRADTIRDHYLTVYRDVLEGLEPTEPPPCIPDEVIPI